MSKLKLRHHCVKANLTQKLSISSYWQLWLRLHRGYMIFTWHLHDVYMILTWYLSNLHDIHSIYMVFTLVFAIFTFRANNLVKKNREIWQKWLIKLDSVEIIELALYNAGPFQAMFSFFQPFPSISNHFQPYKIPSRHSRHFKNKKNIYISFVLLLQSVFVERLSGLRYAEFLTACFDIS